MDRTRVLKPKEWILFLKSIDKPRYKNRMMYEIQLNTGARFNEVRNIKREDIDLGKKLIFLKVTKSRSPFSNGEPRIIPISTLFRNKLFHYLEERNLKPNEYLFKVSQAGYNELLKVKLKIIGVRDYKEFSSHNLRKTLENWLVALDIGSLKILKHFGHDESTAIRHYIQIDYFSLEDKVLIREIIDDLYLNFSETENILYQKIENIRGHLRKINRKLAKLGIDLEDEKEVLNNGTF